MALKIRQKFSSKSTNIIKNQLTAGRLSCRWTPSWSPSPPPPPSTPARRASRSPLNPGTSESYKFKVFNFFSVLIPEFSKTKLKSGTILIHSNKISYVLVLVLYPRHFYRFYVSNVVYIKDVCEPIYIFASGECWTVRGMAGSELFLPVQVCLI